MSRVKIKKIKQGKIDASTFSIKRRLNIDLEDVEASIFNAEQTLSRVRKRDKNRRKKLRKKLRKKGIPIRELKDDEVEKVEMKKTIDDMVKIHEDGHYEWIGHYPAEFGGVIEQINAFYNVKNEIKSYSLSIWPPRENHKNGPVSITNIEKTGLSTAMRVIVVIGSREVFFLSAEQGGAKGDGTVICFDRESFSIPIGASSAIDCSFDNKTVYYGEARKGHRKTKIIKNPSKAYVCVIDGSINPSAVINLIKEEAIKLTGGNKERSERLQKRTAMIFGLDDQEEILREMKELSVKD